MPPKGKIKKNIFAPIFFKTGGMGRVLYVLARGGDRFSF